MLTMDGIGGNKGIMESDVVYSNGVWEVESISLNRILKKNNYRLMQYTGLKDKNGKEIYEGDLIKIKRTIFEIRWDLFKLCFARYKHSTMENYHLTMFDKDCKVIGNIYENKELLKDTNWELE